MKSERFSRKKTNRYLCPHPFENCRVHHYTDQFGQDKVFIYGLRPSGPVHTTRARYSAAIILGRFLKPNEQAKHQDGDFTNSSIGNITIHKMRKDKRIGKTSKPRIQRICKNEGCGKTYETLETKNLKFCSSECYDESQRNGGPHCRNCGAKFTPSKGFASYCSSICKSKSISEKILLGKSKRGQI